jgi:hypothetical protein
MAETRTKRLVKDIDTATRDAYHALRTALYKVEDLKMEIIQQPGDNPFGAEHDEMYKMYLDLSKRFQDLREEIRDRPGNLVQAQPSTPEPPPRVEVPPAAKPSPLARRRMSQPYVLVPVSSATPLPSDVKG